MDPFLRIYLEIRIQSLVFYSLDGIQAVVPNRLWIIDITPPPLLLSKNKFD